MMLKTSHSGTFHNILLLLKSESSIHILESIVNSKRSTQTNSNDNHFCSLEMILLPIYNSNK